MNTTNTSVPPFVHLRVRSEYSLLFGDDLDELAHQAAQFGMPALALGRLRRQGDLRLFGVCAV
jgi:hypothetical protein